jgi:HSP20 family protein
MNIMRYEPWKWLNQMQKELEREFGDTGTESSAVAEWMPAFDVKEEKDRYLLQADLPGVTPEQMEITMENGVLSVRGERNTEARSESEGYKRIERVYGSFHRRFALPDSADSEHINAKFANGVLEILIPKKEVAVAKKIAVNIEGEPEVLKAA